jgi:hypothetical protein
VNPASYLEPRDPFQRGRANQPGPAFPQSPGIILETSGVNLLTTAQPWAFRYYLLQHYLPAVLSHAEA